MKNSICMFLKKSTVMVAILSGLLISACDSEDAENKTESKDSQRFYIFLDYQDSYWVYPTGSVKGPFTSVRGYLIANPLPKVLDVQVNDTSVFNEYKYFPGQIIFSGYSPSSEEDDPLIRYTGPRHTVVAKTTFGEVRGEVDRPEGIPVIQVSETESLKLGEELTITWTKSKADFYYVMIFYPNVVNPGDFLFPNVVDTVVSEQTVTLPKNFFPYDGYISNITVTPINGPDGKVGSKGNLNGVGSGYLYYSGYNGYLGLRLTVGAGFPGAQNQYDFNKSEEKLNKVRNEKIMKMTEKTGSD